MANAVEKLNTIAIANIEKVNTLTDANIEKINTLEFAGTKYTVATGGTITTDGNYKVHTFNSSATFEVTTLGTDATAQYLVIAGAGAGGGSFRGGGGGAGGYRTATGFTVAATSYSITVGAAITDAPVTQVFSATNKIKIGLGLTSNESIYAGTAVTVTGPLTVTNGTGIGSAVNYILFGDEDQAWG